MLNISLSGIPNVKAKLFYATEIYEKLPKIETGVGLQPSVVFRV